jgi:hypothetical protein
MPKISQSELVKQFFQNNPCRDIEHPEVVDWLTAEYKRQMGDIFRDPDRAIRKLHQEGFLIKIVKGIYRYDPKSVKKKNLKQTETGKKMYIRLYELAKKENNEELLSFANDILKVYEKHNINGHIEWEK